MRARINQCCGDQLNTAGDRALESLTQLAIGISQQYLQANTSPTDSNVANSGASLAAKSGSLTPTSCRGHWMAKSGSSQRRERLKSRFQKPLYLYFTSATSLRVKKPWTSPTGAQKCTIDTQKVNTRGANNERDCKAEQPADTGVDPKQVKIAKITRREKAINNKL